MARLWNIGASVLLSGGIVNSGSISGYITDATRRALGMGLSELSDGGVRYFSKDLEILKRAAIQASSQLAYGTLRSYPRFIQYWEQRNRDRYLSSESQTSLANKDGQYYQLISEQQVVAKKKNYTDTIVGRIVEDYLELTISKEGTYYNNTEHKVMPNSHYGFVTFVDLQPIVQVSSRNNIVLTQVQGRDYSRKEFVSGGDFNITINGKITSKYPDLYPEAEVAKFLKLMQFKGVIECDNIILRQFNIERIIVMDYSLGSTDMKNIQPYSITCVAVEPSEAIEIKSTEAEVVDTALEHTNRWITVTNLSLQALSPESLLKWF